MRKDFFRSQESLTVFNSKAEGQNALRITPSYYETHGSLDNLTVIERILIPIMEIERLRETIIGNNGGLFSELIEVFDDGSVWLTCGYTGCSTNYPFTQLDSNRWILQIIDYKSNKPALHKFKNKDEALKALKLAPCYYQTKNDFFSVIAKRSNDDHTARPIYGLVPEEGYTNRFGLYRVTYRNSGKCISSKLLSMITVKENGETYALQPNEDKHRTQAPIYPEEYKVGSTSLSAAYWPAQLCKLFCDFYGNNYRVSELEIALFNEYKDSYEDYMQCDAMKYEMYDEVIDEANNDNDEGYSGSFRP